jgi:hypothetical protein
MIFENKICYLGFIDENYYSQREVLEIAKKSFFRLFLLRELWYEVLTYEEFDQGMIVTMKLS